MPRPCGHSRTAPGIDCTICKVAVKDPRYAKQWDGVDDAPQVPLRTVRETGNLVTCPKCPKNTRFRVYPDMRVEDMLKLISGAKPKEEWPDGWETWSVTVEAHRQLLQEVAAKLPSYSGKHEGRGIVTVAGGSVYFPAAYIMISVLRQTGCELPVEVWHLGLGEMDPQMRGLLRSLGNVSVIDAEPIFSVASPRMMGGWQAKVWSILFSQFREVLFLDADQIPIHDPSYLFNDPKYQSKGCVLWADIANHLGLDIKPNAWKACNLPVPKTYRPVESGQILLDKSRCWKELLLTATLNDHSDFFYRHNAEGRGTNNIYGDKSTFLLAWAMLGTDYAKPHDPIWIGDNRGGAFLQPDLNGQDLFQHRTQPQSKWSLNSNNRQAGLENWDWCMEALETLKTEWAGRPWAWADQTREESQRASQIASPMRLLTSEGSESFQLLQDGSVRGKTRLTNWTLRNLDGTELIVLSVKDRVRHVLGLDKAGRCWQKQELGLILTRELPEGWQYREPFDLSVYDSTVRLNEYQLPDHFNPEDVIIDVGAHFGSFTDACLKRGSLNVIAVEPCKKNCESFRHNLRGRSGWVLIDGAAWRSDTTAPHGKLSYPEGAEHLAGGMLHPSIDGTTPLISLDDLIRIAAGPGRVRLLKLDCEGSEFPILFSSRMLHVIDEIVGEYHLRWLNPVPDGWGIPGVEYTLKSLIALLTDAGFSVSTQETHPTLGNFWARRTHAEVR